MRIGVDLGGTKIEAALIDGESTVVARRRIATPALGYDATLRAVGELVEGLESEFSISASLGIGTPGSVSPRSGLMRNCNSTWLNGQNFKRDMEDLLQRPVRIANDANCFTLSEAKAGAAQNYPCVFGVILGTGVGGGVCVNGNLLTGANAIAGEWGHNPFPLAALDQNTTLDQNATPYQNATPGQTDDRICYCGKRQCIETYLCGPAFAAGYAKDSGKVLPAQAIAALADQGDALALKHVRQYQELLARALATVINLLDPDAIVLGGGMSNIASLYKEVPKLWQSLVFSDDCMTTLLQARHGDSSGVLGAAWLWPAAAPSAAPSVS